tara:strand:- start:5763 stop:7667 length:1905 start_codon:yes stop_codon:yes gene_type:complete
MKIVYEHLLNFLVDKPDIQELSSKLFQLGHEHEIDGSILDMEFTPNRGDCLSLLGLVRDLNVFYQIDIDIPIYNDQIPLLNLNFINQAQEKCPSISFLNIEIKGQITNYKDYLENYFKDLELNKNNFFTDVSNYIAYEMGQPTHSYDYSKVGNDITLKANTGDFKFTTLLGNSIDLNRSELVFTSEEKIINLSGVIGGLDTACTSTTTNALIECAYFTPESIIGKALKYNIHSDASHKFERGTDQTCHEKVLRRFIQIVNDHVEIKKLELYKDKSSNFKETELDFDLKKVNSILGVHVDAKEYKDSLIKLGFEVNKKIKVPSFRSDITHQNDLAEELARVIGYDNIPSANIDIMGGPDEFNSSYEDKIKSFFIDQGFIEVINSSFTSVIDNDYSIKVDNPLDSRRGHLRTSLQNSLIENIIYNENRQKDSIKFFEISDVYTFNQGLKKEKKLGVIVSGRRGHNNLDFSLGLDNKYLKELFQKINFDITKYIINIDRTKFNSKVKTPIFFIELKIEDLDRNIRNYETKEIPLSNFIKYQPISEFPSSYRDLSFSVKDSSRIIEIVNTLDSVESGIIKNSFMFDYYENKKINETKIGYRFIFQSNKKTLTDIEINDEIEKITDLALSIKSVSLPGL